MGTTWMLVGSITDLASFYNLTMKEEDKEG
jgi:hypothetical protein